MPADEISVTLGEVQERVSVTLGEVQERVDCKDLRGLLRDSL